VKQQGFIFEFYKKKTGYIQQQQFDFSIWSARRNVNYKSILLSITFISQAAEHIWNIVASHSCTV